MRESTVHSNSVDASEERLHQGTTVNRLTGIFCILSVVGFVLPFSILLAVLHFTDQPATLAFPIFRQQSTTILLCYYALAGSGLLLIATVLMLQRVLANRATLSLTIATFFGVLGGLMQAIGDLRWPFLLPFLSNAYFDPNSSQASRATILIVFQTVDQFAGVELSEHLYYLCIGVWTLLVGVYLLRSLRSTRWFAWLGIISGCGLLISSIEQFDWPVIGTALLVLVLTSRILWSIWLLVVAGRLLRRPQATNPLLREQTY